jgi:hypothetical protein
MPQIPAKTKFLIHCDNSFKDEMNFLTNPRFRTVSLNYETGKFGNSIILPSPLNDGYGSIYYTTPASMTLTSQKFCFEFWAKFNYLGEKLFFLNSKLWFGCAADGRAFYRLGATGSRIYSDTPIFLTTANEWNHYAFSRDENNIFRVFRQGDVKWSRTDTNDISGVQTSISMLGGMTATGTGSSNFDEFLFVDDAYRTANFIPPTSPYSLNNPILNIGGSTVTKNALTAITSDPTALAAISKVALDPYFSVITNWSAIEFHYTVSGLNGGKKIQIDNDGTQTFAQSIILFSQRAKTGAWSLKKILIRNFDGEYFTVDGIDLPSGLELTVI